MTNAMLTTEDNPYNPFTEFDDWYQYDETHGYHTCSYLARIANTSNLLLNNDNEDEIDRAMDEIVRLNITGNYKKVYE